MVCHRAISLSGYRRFSRRGFLALSSADDKSDRLPTDLLHGGNQERGRIILEPLAGFYRLHISPEAASVLAGFRGGFEESGRRFIAGFECFVGCRFA